MQHSAALNLLMMIGVVKKDHGDNKQEDNGKVKAQASCECAWKKQWESEGLSC